MPAPVTVRRRGGSDGEAFAPEIARLRLPVVLPDPPSPRGGEPSCDVPRPGDGAGNLGA